MCVIQTKKNIIFKAINENHTFVPSNCSVNMQWHINASGLMFTVTRLKTITVTITKTMAITITTTTKTLPPTKKN